MVYSCTVSLIPNLTFKRKKILFRNRIVSPIIDVIDWKTFQYYHSVDLQRGVFDWKLDFHWESLPEHEEKVRQSPISPIR